VTVFAPRLTPAPAATPVMPAVAREFGSRFARPRIAKIYTPYTGFVPLSGRPRLTPELALQLREDGVGRIEAVWWGRHRTMSLFARNRHSVWDD
jgi:hypothetical protein